ncbi:RidA family protein [Phenylobacterium sp.]|uniref:RidA family protein n=1 Tax=Phenylobacterium sp. TaxID=1871053 RepID=UPI002FC8C18B
MATPADRLLALGLTLPTPSVPIASYQPCVRDGNLAHISGQLSATAERSVKGVVGIEVDLSAATAGARLCGLNILAQLVRELGDLGRVEQILKLNVFVQAGSDFVDIPKVANGCSDLLAEVLGEAGRHARSAVGVYRLPLNCSVEVDALVRVS